MESTRTSRRQRARTVALVLTVGAFTVAAASLAGASGASSGGTAAGSARSAGYPQGDFTQPWALQRFLISGADDADRLSRVGVDVTEGVTKNPDGTAWIALVVTPAQRDYLASLGFRPGEVQQTSADAERERATMLQTALSERQNLHAAITGKVSHRKHFDATEVLKVTRADYFTSYSGAWISVEAKTTAAQGNASVPAGTPGCPTTGSNRCSFYGGSQTGACWGNPAGGAAALTTAACPTVSVAISTDGTTFTTAPSGTTNMSAFVDDGVYLYHRLLIRLSNFAGIAAAPVPVKVRLSSNAQAPNNVLATRDVTNFVDPVANFDPGFQRDFFSRYQTPQDGKAFIEQLASENPTIAHIIKSPFSTNGYMRPAQAAIGCSVSTVNGNSSIGAPSAVGGSPAGYASPSNCSTAQQGAAVMLESKAMGNQYLGDPNAPGPHVGTDLGNAITFQIVDPTLPCVDAPPFLCATMDANHVSVTGNAITLTRATIADGTAVDTVATTGENTAAKVVAAVNANTAAAALVKARRYQEGYSTGTGGNAGNSVVAVNASPVPLSDALFAPQPGNPAFPAGFEPAREPFNWEFLRICKVCDGSKPGFFVFAEHHAREWVTPLVALETAGRLVRNYGTDPETTAFVDNLDIFILPAHNADGSNYSLLQGGASSQRKNMARYCGTTPGQASSTSWNMQSLRSANVGGVDNNRNYTVGSFFDGYEGADQSCTSEVYAGPAEGSEQEEKNEFWLLETYPNIRFSMNIHTQGGYFMWAPASYITQGRIALPYATKGWQDTFWDTGKSVLSRIKQVRGTVVPPARTGPVADVLYSAAGNQSDEAWYHYHLISYDFECGVQLYSTTSTTSNSGNDVGFQPSFGAQGSGEGRQEGQEFASGMYGLMAKALAYGADTTAPVATPSVPSGTISQTPISLVFTNSEPADIYYTTDGSNPTTSSTIYEASGFREQEGATITFAHDTTLKWFAVDPKGNTSTIQTAYFGVGDEKPVTSITFDPLIHNGWYASPSITLSAVSGDGGGAGIMKIEYTLDGAAGWTTYTHPISGFTTGNHFIQYRATDNLGRVEDTKLTAFKVDAVKPKVTISKPGDGSVFPLDKVVAASYKCSDNESGLDTCVGTVANGANLDTSTLGDHAFSVTGTDLAGNQKVVTVHYRVVYTWNGFFNPVTNTETSQLNLVHAGDLIKIGFGLNGDRGLSIGTFSSSTIACPAWPPHTIPAAGAGTSPGLAFGVASGHYTYGWQTSVGWANSCRRFSLALNDGTPPHTADFMFFS